jgi:predicted ATPase
VLDNCEHLLAACRDLVAALLRKCPQVRILATSREGLGVPGETLWRVPSLSVPEDIDRLPPSEELVLRYDAVRLFVERAMATAPGFTVTRENGPAVAQVCQRLDGIPLAIELAAARVKVLAVEQIVARLDDRFRLLTGGSPIALPRQQTLRAMMEWSYDLLTEKEKILFRRLAVSRRRIARRSMGKRPGESDRRGNHVSLLLAGVSTTCLLSLPALSGASVKSRKLNACYPQPVSLR